MSQPATGAVSTEQLERAIATLGPLFDALEAALDCEAQALVDSSGATLLDAVGGKQQALRDLERGLAQEGIAALLQTLSSAEVDALADAPFWQAFTARLRHCRGMNLAAGSAIALAQRQTQVGLELLGQGGAANAYDQSGRTALDHRGRDLARC